MADYRKCIPVILKHEGGYCEDEHDAGGATNWGVSLAFAKDTGDLELFDKDDDGDIDRLDIRKLTIEDATRAFKKYFWDKLKLDDEPSNRVALTIFDAAVNHGIWNCSNMVQKTLVDIGFNIAIDGKIGPKTLKALHAADEQIFCNEFHNIRERFYYKIVERKPTQKVFLKGWLNRIKSMKKILEDF